MARRQIHSELIEKMSSSSFSIVLSLLIFEISVSTSCPSIYQMIDKDHSFCSKKIAVQSLIPTADDIQLILKMHNDERMNVAAKDMQKMYWNSDLALIAQRYAEHCVFDHDKSNQRQAPRIPVHTGQNLAMGYPNWALAIQAWADEKKDFVYGSSVKHGVVGHYTQMVCNTSVLVGCGQAICPPSKYEPNRDWSHYVCNYVTGQVGGNTPYVPGDPSTPLNERFYDCHGLVCLYGGEIDLQQCQCRCPSHASGKSCEDLDCSSLSNDCAFGSDVKLCTLYANVPPECPKFCGLCDRYEAVKKYYGSNMIDEGNGGTRDTSFSARTLFVFVIGSTLFIKE